VIDPAAVRPSGPSSLQQLIHPGDATVREAERIMVICNACRYCEGYCAVFQAMATRRAFPPGDLRYLANLCHNCGECLYACQYAPPHEFAVNVPATFARLRLESYESYAWPAVLSHVFRRSSIAASLTLAAGMIVVVLVLTIATGRMDRPELAADFYAVLPHQVMVALFGAVFGFALVALGVGLAKFDRDSSPRPRPETAADGRGPAAVGRAISDVLTLKNLHAQGADCTYGGEESRTSLRRWLHHCTFYGFGLCFASTSVAAVYHWLGWPAPYGYASLPVVLGSLGGFGLLIGPAGLYAIGRTRDPDATDPTQRPLDHGLIVLLFLSSLTGLTLLMFRETGAMAPLLVVHLGVVLALFLMLPYGKFVHGLYRAAALVRHAQESSR
jgi:citrate/tricarballylate utilization protein